jgi:hypothetical protein
LVFALLIYHLFSKEYSRISPPFGLSLSDEGENERMEAGQGVRSNLLRATRKEEGETTKVKLK